jgi:hypothetical protein
MGRLCLGVQTDTALLFARESREVALRTGVACHTEFSRDNLRKMSTTMERIVGRISVARQQQAAWNQCINDAVLQSAARSHLLDMEEAPLTCLSLSRETSPCELEFLRARDFVSAAQRALNSYLDYVNAVRGPVRFPTRRGADSWRALPLLR